MSFETLTEAIRATNNPTVMGLDVTLKSIPEHITANKSAGEAIYEFNKGLIDCAYGLIPAVKPQSAFYEMYGLEGLEALHKTIKYAKAAGLYVVLDVKRGDIGSTAEAYAEAYLNADSGIDCITVNPYLGIDGVKPFMDKANETGKSIFVLVKTSNPSSADFQDLECGGMPLYRKVAEKLVEWNGDNNICGAVVGATYPHQLAELCDVMPNVFLLIPGYGAQGGNAEGLNVAAGRCIVNSSRGLIYAYAKSGDSVNYQKHTRQAIIEMKEDLKNII